MGKERGGKGSLAEEGKDKNILALCPNLRRNFYRNRFLFSKVEM